MTGRWIVGLGPARTCAIEPSSAIRVGCVLIALAVAASGCSDDSAVPGAASETSSTTITTTTSTTITTTTTCCIGPTLETVRARDELRCGVGVREGFADGLGQAGSESGFDVDFCRAVAIAALGAGGRDKVDFVDASDSEGRFELLLSGEIDVLIRTTTHTLSRDSVLGLDFGPTTYYDGQRFLGDTDLFTEQSDIAQLDGTSVCVGAGTTTVGNLEAAADEAGVDVTLVLLDSSDAAKEAFLRGDCDSLTSDGALLAGVKLIEDSRGSLVIFPPSPISREPLGPVYREGDSQWADIVNWAVYATFIADQFGVNSSNIDEMRELPPNAEIAHLLGVVADGDEDDQPAGYLQAALGIDADALYFVIKRVGNYDEIFTRNLDQLDLRRGGTVNDLWNRGGMIYAPPAN